MRIERLDLHSYGHLRERSLELSLPSNGLVVVLGPNEAGKSTAMRALDALLFGIQRTTADHFGQGRASLRVGGRITSIHGASLEVVRQGLNSAPLVNEAGNPIPEAEMLEMLGHTDRTLFRTLFRVDHDELSNGSAALLETDGEIGRLVFGASLGSVALTGVLRDLDTRAAKLFRSGAKSTDAHASLLTHRRLAREAREKRVKPKVWNDLDQRHGSTEAEIAGLQERQRESRRDEFRLARIKSALPLLTERSRLARQLDDLHASGPVQPRAWADEMKRLLDELYEAGKKRARADEQHRGVTAHLAEVDVDDGLLANVERIGVLLEGSGRYRKDRKDVPKLEELLRGHHRAIDTLLVRLGAPTEADPDQLTQLTDAQRDAIERLADRRSRIDTDLATATTEVHDLDRKIGAAAGRLDELDKPPDTAVLSRASDTTKSLGPIEEQLAKTSAELQQFEESTNDLVRRLGFGEIRLDEFAAIPVPAHARVLRERSERADLQALEGELDTRIVGLEGERRELVEERAGIEADIDLPDRATLDSAREHRDEGWQLVRSSLDGTVDALEVATWARDASLPDTYEGTVRHADAVADRRYEHAAQLTTAARIAARVELLDSRLVECAQQRSVLENRALDIEQAWAEEWAHLGLTGIHPDDALEWLDGHKHALELMEKRRAATTDIARISDQMTQSGALLREALTALGAEPEAGGLAALLRQSEDELAETTRRREARNQSAQNLESLIDQRPNRVANLERTQADLDEWSTQWADALQPIRLDGQADPAAAVTTVRLILDLRKKRDEEKKDGGRLRGLRADIVDYEESARPAIEELAPDLLDGDPADAVSTLNARLKTAIENRARHQELANQLDGLAHDIDAERIAQEEAAREIEGLRERASLGTDVDLSAVIARSENAADLRDEIAKLESTLVAQGDGKSVDEIEHEATAYDMDGDQVGAELISVGDDLRALEGQLGEAQSTRGEIQTLLRQIDGSADAADLDQDAEEALARTAQLLDEYTRVALASALLKRVVSAYGEQHQRPILDEAATIFRSLTLRAFNSLLVDTEEGKQVLLAQRRNGELLHTLELSSGTRDQLYLALRLAGVRHHLERVDEPLPLILDDLLVNFDDERSAATLEVLAQFGAQTQVLMFTHEQGLADLAMDTLGSERCAVEVITARDHDAPRFPAAEPKPTSSRTPGALYVDYQERVLQCLRTSSEPLGKATLLKRAGVPDDAWQSVIKALIEQGLIEQQGQKRGAKYRARA